MDLMSFIRTVDPTKVRIGERQRDADEPKLLETIVGRVVSLVPVAPDRSSGELEAIVDKLFDEGEVRQKKQKTKVVDAGEPLHPAKKLRDDYGVPGGPTVGGQSQSSIRQREGGDHAELLAGANLRTLGAPQRTSMPIITGATTTTPTADPAAIAKEKLVGSSLFGVDILPRAEVILFLVASLIVLMSLSVEVRMRAEYNIKERRRLNSIVEEKDALLKANDEEIGSLKAQLVLKEAETAKAIRLRAEASNFQAVEKSLQSEVAALKERNNLLETEKSGLDVTVPDLAASVKVREQEVADLDAVVTSVKLQNDNLVDQNGVNILKSIDEGPYQMGTVQETLAEGTEGAPQFGPERPRVYSDLSPEEKDRYNADIRATNILLQGLPKDIYILINHYTDAKDVWDNHKGESIHDYYVRFAKLINDMRNIKMTMSRMQLNSKFVNNMLPEWGRFVTAENKMMLERFSQNTFDPLALMSNVSNPQRYSPSSSTSSSTQVPQHLADNPHLDSSGHDNTFDDDVDEQHVQDLALNVDNVFHADDYDAFDSDVDEAPTTQTMFMANLSSADPTTRMLFVHIMKN
nr:hypothetical protein [Tanacetum cinerariifolium]